MKRVGVGVVALLLWCSLVRAESPPPTMTPTPPVEAEPPELMFFKEKIVAQHHFSGPMNPLRSAFLRKDGHVLMIGAKSQFEAALADPSSPEGKPSGAPWRESQIDVALIKKIARAAEQSGVCKAPSTPGFSVGGAWMILIDFDPPLRCKYRRRARLEIPPPILKLRRAIEAAMDAANVAPALHEGRRSQGWPDAARSPL